ncbi:hypothetical protein ACPCG0_11070 [Propionibacteriaceae bacterium Y1923]|uniref:hypothetical protein n=1 Tax=Aestuariimicrobium sp. Y1814 TaxID=3418742 RepID=UPI003C2610A6
METLRIECPGCAEAGHSPEDCLVAALLPVSAPAAPTPSVVAPDPLGADPLTLAERRAMELFDALGMLAPDDPPQVVVTVGSGRGRGSAHLPRAQ